MERSTRPSYLGLFCLHRHIAYLDRPLGYLHFGSGPSLAYKIILAYKNELAPPPVFCVVSRLELFFADRAQLMGLTL